MKRSFEFPVQRTLLTNDAARPSVCYDMPKHSSGKFCIPDEYQRKRAKQQEFS